MANKTKKENQGKIVGICVGVAAVILGIVLIIALAINANKGLNDGYFVSDDNKLVLTIDSEELGIDTTDEESGEALPVKAHIVWTYEGDKVTGMNTYYEYKNAEDAKKAYNLMKEDETTEIDAKLDGKYIIVSVDESEYEDMTVEDAKSQIEFYEMIRNMDLESGEEGETESTEEE